MSLKINRFQAKVVVNGTNITVKNGTTVVVKDLQKDKICVVVNFGDTIHENSELAKEVVELIENRILEQEDARTKD